MKPRIRNRTAGFTLVETLVVLVLTGIVAAGLYQMLYAGRRSHEIGKHQIEMQQNARVAIGSLAEDFRHVSYGKDPTQPSIQYAAAESLVFVADIMPEVSGAEMVSYYLDPDGDLDTPNPGDTMLMKAVADSGGAVLYLSPQSYGIAMNGLRLTYFNGSGVEIPSPVPQPELIGEMAIEITATESARWKQQPYSSMTLSATVYPRNLPLTPARSRPSTPACDDPVYPNCSSATMSWETPTTNTDGTDLPLSEISHFNIYYGPDPDDMSLNARVARTINEWTITGLTCETYYAAVTCVSRSGVESYQCRQPVGASGGSTPKAPADLATTDSLGVKLNWPPVTQFIDDTPITVPVEYLIHRDTVSGFTAGDGNQIAMVSGSTQYLDTTVPNDCGVYYFAVRARVCCSVGGLSPEVSATRPATPGCPTNLVGVPGGADGEIDLTWTHPAQRADLTSLPIGEITATWVYYDTIPGFTTQYAVVPGNGTSATLAGLVGCETYYLHARTVDQCGHASESQCLGNETAVSLTGPCDPAVPSAPAWLLLQPLDNRVDLTWPANQEDCDLEGYRVYYGYATGNYTGTGAAEGNSPVEVAVDQVTVGGQCLLSLTNLEGCANVYTAVAAIDQCAPPAESPYSPEAYGITTCNPCQIEPCCPTWVATMPSGYTDLHLEVFTQSGSDETIAALQPTWSGPARVLQVLAGRPLVQIWNADGTAGQDGPVGPQGSGALLDLDDVVIPYWTSQEDGEPIALAFDSDVRAVNFDLVFRNPSGGTCTANGTNRGAAVFDDFDDGDINGWTVRSGTWSATDGELNQAATSGSRILISSGSFADLTYEGKIKITNGTAAYLVFRYRNDSNYYMVGIVSGTDIVRLARYRGGSFSQRATYSAPIDPDTWYDLKVVVQGKTARIYFNCNNVIVHTDSQMEPEGRIGFRTYYTAARYDDIRCQNVADLP